MMNFESNKIPRQPLKSKRMQTFISKTEATMSHESEATISSDNISLNKLHPYKPIGSSRKKPLIKKKFPLVIQNRSQTSFITKKVLGTSGQKVRFSSPKLPSNGNMPSLLSAKKVIAA